MNAQTKNVAADKAITNRRGSDSLAPFTLVVAVVPQLQREFRVLALVPSGLARPQPRLHAVDERLALAIIQLPQSDGAPQMGILVCVTARTSQGALAGDFNR